VCDQQLVYGAFLLLNPGHYVEISNMMQYTLIHLSVLKVGRYVGIDNSMG